MSDVQFVHWQPVNQENSKKGPLWAFFCGINIYMANFLSGFLNGVFGSEGYLRNQQHASRLYHDPGFYNFAPKAGWMYYVVMSINPGFAVQRELGAKWKNRYQNMVGILAKSVQMPGFKIATETLNQYNRKTVVQTKINYDPVTIEFHDDHANATNDLWKNYYQYYYADSAYESKQRGRTGPLVFNPSYTDTKTGDKHYKYGFNKPHELPFFNQIEIYQLNRQEYNGIKLVNPIVTGWQHGQLSQGENRFVESKMTVSYESVSYTSGLIKADLKNITENYYDNVPSPVRPGGLFGAITGATDIFGTVSNLSSPDASVLDLVKLGVQTTQVARTVKNITSDSLAREGYSVLAGGLSAVATGGRASATEYGNRFVNGLGTNNAVNLFRGADNPSVKNIIQGKPFGT